MGSSISPLALWPYQALSHPYISSSSSTFSLPLPTSYLWSSVIQFPSLPLKDNAQLLGIAYKNPIANHCLLSFLTSCQYSFMQTPGSTLFTNSLLPSISKTHHASTSVPLCIMPLCIQCPPHFSIRWTYLINHGIGSFLLPCYYSVGDSTLGNFHSPIWKENL